MDGIHPVQLFPVVEQNAEVVANLFVNAEYKHLIVAASAPVTSALPGQFFHLLCPASEAGEPFLRRPMSIYLLEPERGRVHFLYKLIGPGTRGLASLVPGQRLNMLGRSAGGSASIPRGRTSSYWAAASALQPWRPWPRRRVVPGSASPPS